MSTPAQRDDRVLPATRWAALVVFAILVPAVIVLWGAPGRTADLWAWTIKPDLTPIFLGSGYGAGAYFFWRTFRARALAPVVGGRAGRVGVRRSDADRDDHPLGPLQPRRRPGARGDRVLRLDDRVHRLAVRGLRAVVAQPGDGLRRAARARRRGPGRRASRRGRVRRRRPRLRTGVLRRAAGRDRHLAMAAHAANGARARELHGPGRRRRAGARARLALVRAGG